MKISDIDVQCEEKNIDSNEKEVKGDNVLICNEEYQKESLDSIETQKFFLDGHVKSQGSKEVISKFENQIEHRKLCHHPRTFPEGDNGFNK